MQLTNLVLVHAQEAWWMVRVWRPREEDDKGKLCMVVVKVWLRDNEKWLPMVVV